MDTKQTLNIRRLAQERLRKLGDAVLEDIAVVCETSTEGLRRSAGFFMAQDFRRLKKNFKEHDNEGQVEEIGEVAF